MRYLSGFMCVLALAVTGCSETAGAGGSGGSDLCEGMMCEDDGNECTEDVCNPADGRCGVPVGNGTACSDGACMDGECTALTTVSGTVVVDEVEAAEGATVSWLGSTLSTTADESGAFSFEVPVGNLFLQASKAGTWGDISLYWTEGASELEINITSDAGLEDVLSGTGVDIDATKGIVDVGFLNYSRMGGESATISEAYDSSWVQDANLNNVMSNALVRDGFPWLGFVNVVVTDELTVSPAGAEGVNMCGLLVPGTVYPVLAKFVTGVDVMCTPL